jgi:hypothetical protein
MKRIAISLILVLIFTGLVPAKAQQITLEGGYLNPKRFGSETSETYFDAIKIGALYTYDWKYNIGFQSGLLLNTGYSNKIQRFAIAGDSIKYSTWSIGLDIPIRAIYKLKLFGDFKLFGFAGPNIQIGLFQPQNIYAGYRATLNPLVDVTSGTFDLYSNGEQKTYLNRINLQLGAGGGLEWRKYSIKGGYDWGINNLDRTKTDYVTQGNWYVSFGYQIK